MKKTLFLALALALGFAAAAQSDTVADAGQYSRQYNKIYKAYVKQPENVANTLALAQFYADTLNPMHNFATAMKYITSAEERFIFIVEDRDSYKEVSRLLKKKINIQLIRQTKYDIILKARNYLDNEPVLSDVTLDSYAEAFKNDLSTMRMIDYRRMENRYRRVCEEGTLAAYKAFLENYSATAEGEEAARTMGLIAERTVADAQNEKQVDSLLEGYLDVETVKDAAMRRKSALAYAEVCANPTPQAYRRFLAKYPGSNEYTLVLEKMEHQIKDEYDAIKTPRGYADFALDNPDNPLAEKAIGELKRLISEERDMEALDIYLKEFPLDVNYNDIYLAYYNWHTEEGNAAPLERFSAMNPDFPFKMALNDAIAAAKLYDSIDITMPFAEKDFGQWTSKIYHLTGKKESFVGLQRTLQQFIAAKNWPKIQERIEFFTLSFEDNCVDEVAELRSIVERPENDRLAYTPIVRPAYDMLHPVLHPDGKRIFYNRDVNGEKCIQMAVETPAKKSVVWKGAGNIVFTNVDNRNVDIYSFYDNGNKMLMGLDGNIVVAEQEGEGWTVTDVLPAPINSEYNDFDAVMLPDGSGILFASDRPGGQNLQPSRSYFHGDTALASDIYFVPRDENGWGRAVNLGINVNSPYMECSPSISSDLKTLYFITDGRGGLGYGDLYYTTRDNASDWKHWSAPVNYGKEVNSGFNEMSVTMSGDGKSLTVCSNAHGRYGCYSVPAMHTINNRMRTVSVQSVDFGFVADIVDVETQKSVCSDQSIQRGESWQTALYAGKQYLLFSRCEGLFVPAVLFNPSKTTVLSPKAYDCQSELSGATNDDRPVLLSGILFEDKKVALKRCADKEIEHLAAFLNTCRDINVEIIVHVDGDNDTFCFNLSHSRGQEIKKALIARGVDADRVAVSGYGNSETKRGAAQTSVSVKAYR